MTNCEICDISNAQYKCSKCRIKYCSVSCYKNHQEKGCEPIIYAQSSEQENTHYNYITADTISPEKLKLLDGSKELRDILKNPHVRDILLEVDKSQKVSAIMDKAMKEPIFVEFADICLKLVQDEKRLNSV